MRMVFLLAVGAWVSGLSTNVDADPTANLISTNDVLLIDRCVSSVAGGKCTLTIGPLRATGDIYGGEYYTKISPYFFKNEEGRLAILITREAIDQACAGRTVEITGTATQNGKDHKSRRIDATATPLDGRQGTLRFRFQSGEREMVFDTRYRFIAADQVP